MPLPGPDIPARLDAFRDLVRTGAGDWERDRRHPAEAFAAAGEAGLAGLMVPRDLGGLGLGLAGAAEALGAVAAEDMGVAFALEVHVNVTAGLAAAGAEDHKARYLEDLLAGRLVGAFLLTEPGVGSDAAAIRTRARRDGGDWIVDGAKAWVTNGVGAGLLNVFAQTDPDLGWRGIAAFLVEADRPGVSREPAYRLLGGHAAGVCGIRFDSVRVPAGAMIHPPGEAFKAAMRGIDIARAGVAAMCCGMMESSLRHALEAVASRQAFDRTIGDFQGVRWMLADAATALEATRLLARRAATLFDAGEDAAVACAHAKKFATGAAWKAIGDCMQVMGARGFRVDDGHPVARHLAGARMAQWLDGATEIQNVVIARHLMKHGP